MIVLRGSGQLKLDDVRVMIRSGRSEERLISGLEHPVSWDRMTLRIVRSDGTYYDIDAESGTVIETSAKTRWQVTTPSVVGPFERWTVGFEEIDH